MSTKLEVANMALSYLGDAFITADDLTNPSTVHAQLVVNVLDITLDDFLAEHDWDFSTVWSSTLTALSGVSSPDYPFYFDLPNGSTPVLNPDPYCLLVRATDKDDAQEPWVVEGRRLGMFVSNSVRIKYRSRPSITAWTPAAAVAVSYNIAAKIAYPITESQSVTDQMKKLYEFELRRARSQDGFQAPARATRTRSLIDVRRE